MNCPKLLVACCLYAATAFPATPEATPPPESTPLPEVVVTALRPGLPQSMIGQKAQVIQREEIAASGANTLLDVLKYQPGLIVNSYGPRSTTAAISIRGMSTRHTKLLVDGVPYEDVSSTQVVPLLGNIPAALIERIEVVRGPVSLAGSSAMGGVINVITRRPVADGKVHGEVEFNAGSHGRMGGSAIFYGAEGDWDYTLAIGRQSERGISSVYRSYDYTGKPGKPASAYNDADGFRGVDTMLRLGYALDDKWRLEVGGNFAGIDEEYDTTPEDGNIREKHLAGRMVLSGTGLDDGRFDTSLSLSAIRSDRRYQGEDSRYLGEELHLTWQGTLHIDDNNDLTLGFDREIQRMRHWLNDQNNKYNLGDDKRMRINSAYLTWQTRPLEALALNFTGKYLHNSQFGGEWCGDASAKYTFHETGTTLHAAVGKGYRQPSLFELVGDVTYYYFGYGYRYYGNPDLKPENAIAWEAGVTQEILEEKLLTLDVTYFQSRVHHFIDTTGFTPVNLDQVHIRGVEVTLESQIATWLKLNGGYSWQHQRNLQNGARHLANVPTHSFAFNACFMPLQEERLILEAGGMLCGSRFNQMGQELNNYCLMHAAATWKFTPNLKLQVRVDNLLNERYQENATWGPFGTVYNTAGRTYSAALSYRW